MFLDYPNITVLGSLQGDRRTHEFLAEHSVRIFSEHPFFKGGKIEITFNNDGPPPFTPVEDYDYLLNISMFTADGRWFFLYNPVGSNDYVLQDGSLFE